MPDIMDRLSLGSLELPNRIVMAPMTRARALEDGTSGPSAALYYAQRSSAALIISEGAHISGTARGYMNTPGIHDAVHRESWRTITDAVHERGGRIFAQLWHVGRISHPFFHDGELPGGPSALPVEGHAFTPDGPQPIPVPRALTEPDIAAIVGDFANAATIAREAGFDGVELHGANGFLLDQFLRDGSNRRTGRYGDGIEGRMRLPLEIVEAVGAVWRPERISYRISPHFHLYSMSDSDPAATFGALARALSGKAGLLHVVEPVAGPVAVPQDDRLLPMLRAAFEGTIIANGGFDGAAARQMLAAGDADLIAFGMPFIANPDLPARLAGNHPLTPVRQETAYGGGDEGYIDYPPMSDIAAGAEVE